MDTHRFERVFWTWVLSLCTGAMLLLYMRLLLET